MAADSARHSSLTAPIHETDPDFVESLFDAPSTNWSGHSGDRKDDGRDEGTEPLDRSSVSGSGRGGNRRGARRSASRRWRGRIIPVLAVLVIVAVAFAGVAVARTALHSIKHAADYSGAGTGHVTVEVRPGDSSRDIAKTLHDRDVVASTQAFVDAAAKSGKSADLQSGWFALRHHMSGAAAVSLLLDPRSRVVKKVTISEGMIEPAVLAALAKATGLSAASLVAASKHLAAIGVPVAFGAKSAEGFLFPATYQFDPDLTASDALQEMTTQFQVETRKLNLLASAASLRLRPYQLLIIASMVEAEARFPADRPKVARVILNRLAKHMNLGFDSTTAYGLKIQGKDPQTATYKEKSPYNTRLNPGLPPTPIGNPGEAALRAAQHPTPGNWLYFVSKDAAGHLLFTDDSKVFDEASKQCLIHKWGCT